MKTGLVLEGGAMQGIYTAGVLDVFMEQGITFDGVIGVSAGALFGVNLLSGQKGRVLRYNKRFNGDKNYMGVHTLLKTGNIVSTEYAYERVPRELDPFDDEVYKKVAAEIPFYAVMTNIRTGEPEYVRITSVFEQMDELRASGSMPYVSKPVEINGELYLDGAIVDSIPFEKMRELGYDRLVVVLTKNIDYVKKPLPKTLTNLMYMKKYPQLAEKINRRHIMYRSQIERLKKLERQGGASVIRPSKPMYVSKIETDPQKMDELYELGRKDAMRWIQKYQRS